MKYLFYLIPLLLLSACYEPIEENASEKEEVIDTSKVSQLKVAVFSSLPQFNYPTEILVYDTEGNRVEEQTLTESTPTTTLSLHRGHYRIVAIAGANNYQLNNTHTIHSDIRVPDTQYPAKPLLLGQAVVTLSSPSAVAHIQMISQTAGIEISASELSADVEQVQITLSDMYSAIGLLGNVHDAQQYTISCTKHQNVWSAGPVYLLPSLNNNTLASVVVRRQGQDMIYGYTMPFPIRAGYHYELSPTEENILGVNGTMVDANSTTYETLTDTLYVATLPKAPCLWDGHLIAYTDNSNGVECDALLISINEWDGIYSANNEEYPSMAMELAESYQEGGALSHNLCHWSIPSRDIANTLKSLYAGNRLSLLNNLLEEADLPMWSQTDHSGNSIRYLCNDAQHTFTLANTTSGITKAGTKATYQLRLVKKIHMVIR